MEIMPTNFLNRNGKVNAEFQQSPEKSNLADNVAVRTHHATAYLYRFFWLSGISKQHKYRIPYIMYSVVLNGLVNVYYPFSFLISYLSPTTEAIVISEYLASVQTCISTFSSSFKFFTMAYMMRRLRSTDVVLERLDRRCKRHYEFEALSRLARLCRRIVIIYFCVYMGFAIVVGIGSIMRGRPAYGVYLPLLDWHRSQTDFMLSSFIEFLCLLFICFTQVSDDAYALIFVNILRTHMKILRLRIRKLGHDDAANLSENLTQLKLCIEDHKNFLEVYDTVVPVISITVFTQFLVTGVAIGITVINILLFSNDFKARATSTIYLLALIMEILPICYYSQCLMDESNQLSVAILHSNWIGQEKRYRKMLIFFTQRSQREMLMTAGKLIPITLGSFVAMVRFSFSLYTIVENMSRKQKLV